MPIDIQRMLEEASASNPLIAASIALSEIQRMIALANDSATSDADFRALSLSRLQVAKTALREAGVVEAI